jgi:outer membrane protein
MSGTFNARLALVIAASALVPAADAPPPLGQEIEREILALRLGPPTTTIELSLEDAVTTALKNNFDIKISEKLSAQDEARLRAARAKFDPYLFAAGSLGGTRYPTVRVLDVGGPAPTTDVAVSPGKNQSANAGLKGTLHTGMTYSVSVQEDREDTPLSGWYGINPRYTVLINASVTQPLLRGGWFAYNLADIRVAENSTAIAQAALEEQLADVVAAVDTAYWNLISAWRRLRVQEEAYRESRTFLAQTERRSLVGYQASEIDVAGARGQVEIRKAELIGADAGLQAARDTLLAVMNPTGSRSFRDVRLGPPGQRRRVEEIAIEPTTIPPIAPLDVNIDEAVDCAFRHRPLYVSYELQIESQEVEVTRRENELLPRLDLLGEWNQHGLEETSPDAWDELGTGRYYTWFLGLQLEVPLFNRAAQARLTEAEERLWELSYQKKKLENTLVLDVIKATRDLRAAYGRVQTTRAAAEYSRKQLDGETKRLARGMSTSYTVLQMQNDLLRLQLEELLAAVTYNTARVALERAKGTLLAKHGIQLKTLFE